ncbi:hypothetical protein E2C01_097561 [Portunus trituberculatus]|uniref:Uncharacterized protein n=1 Tax=Portunus trituberculatus TaxID=210409 RepID=A0A5B7K601_PORTR|nr:hypothetical protein [Portunus trituberculatus]
MRHVTTFHLWPESRLSSACLDCHSNSGNGMVDRDPRKTPGGSRIARRRVVGLGNG